MSGLVGHHGRTGNLGQIGSGEVLIQDYAVTSAVADVTIDYVFSAEFRNYKTVVTDLVINTGSNINLYFRFKKLDGTTSSGSTYRTVTGGGEGHNGGGNFDQHQRDWNGTQAMIDCAGGSLNPDAASGGWNAEMYFYNPFSATRYPRCSIQSGMLRYGGDVAHTSDSYIIDVATNTIQYRGFQMFLSGSATIVSGKFTTYGYRINKDYNLH